jgi:hypothetical protein
VPRQCWMFCSILTELHSKFVHEGTAVNSQYYLGVMERLHACMRGVSSIATAGCCCMTTHPLTARWNVKQFLASKSVCVAQHHPYSSDMASALFSLPKGETGPRVTLLWDRVTLLGDRVTLLWDRVTLLWDRVTLFWDRVTLLW